MLRRNCCPYLLAALAILIGCRPGDPPLHLVLVTVDTLRADHLGAYGAPRGSTPNLDRLAGQSQVFQIAYAPTPFTLPSLSAMLTGRYPEAIGMVSNRARLPAGIPTLATELKKAGWVTGATVGNFVLRRRTGLDAGFDLYDDELPDREPTRPRIRERRATSTTDAALRTFDALRAGGRPCFLWVHYQDPHGPYVPPWGLRAHYLEREQRAPDGSRRLPVARNHRPGLGVIPLYQHLGQSQVAFYRAGYAGEVAHVDAEFGRLLAGLEARAVAGQTVVAFTADHGESLGEGDYWFAHGEYLSEALVRVPLMVRIPGRPPRERTDVATLIDVFPTLITLLTGDGPGGLPGRDLLAADATDRSSNLYLSNVRAIPRFGWVERGYKYVVSLEGPIPRERLHRIGDPDTDLASAQPERLGSMRRAAQAWRRRLSAGAAEREPALTADEREALRALGYVEDP